jgi:hypothetical protein
MIADLVAGAVIGVLMGTVLVWLRLHPQPAVQASPIAD